MVTPLTKNLLGWTDTQNALLFVAIGVTAVVGYGVTIVRKNNFLKIRSSKFYVKKISDFVKILRTENDVIDWRCDGSCGRIFTHHYVT